MVLRLPWPPSINHYYGAAGKKRFLTAAAKAFRGAVLAEAIARCGGRMPKPMSGPLEIWIMLYEPEKPKRNRDLDNHSGKAIFDALQHARVFHNDCQIRRKHVEFGESIHDGMALIDIVPLNRPRGNEICF